MSKYSQIGGIMSIISGALGVLTGIGMAVGMVLLFRVFMRNIPYAGPGPMPGEIFDVMMYIYIAMGAVMVLIGVGAIVGGVFALKRKHWGWALAGSIAASMAFYPSGIAAIIFTCLGKAEFERPAVEIIPAPPIPEIPNVG